MVVRMGARSRLMQARTLGRAAPPPPVERSPFDKGQVFEGLAQPSPEGSRCYCGNPAILKHPHTGADLCAAHYTLHVVQGQP